MSVAEDFMSHHFLVGKEVRKHAWTQRWDSRCFSRSHVGTSSSSGPGVGPAAFRPGHQASWDSSVGSVVLVDFPGRCKERLDDKQDAGSGSFAGKRKRSGKKAWMDFCSQVAYRAVQGQVCRRFSLADRCGGVTGGTTPEEPSSFSRVSIALTARLTVSACPC